MTRAGRPRSAKISSQPETSLASRLRLASALAGRLRGRAFLDLGGDPAGAVFLAGTGRSGTTWASQMVGRGGEYRLVFEPFDPRRVPLVRGFRSKQYLRPQDDRKEYLRPARAVLSGRVRGGWTDRFNRKTLARRRLIKDIRANLLLGWMHAHFPRMPLVLLLRHPCAVVRSRLRLGWQDNLDETMDQPALIEDFLHPFEARIRAAKTPFERHLFLWCIDNYVPLQQLTSDTLHVAFFENMLTDPHAELTSLFRFLNVEPDGGVYRTLSKPKADDRLAGWRHETSAREMETTMEVLSLFGLDRVYGEDSMPDPDGLPVGGHRDLKR